MGKILDDILKEVKSNEVVEEVKEICNKIWVEEEEQNVIYQKVIPEGANIFLAVQVPPKAKGEVSFLSIERDPIDEWVCNYYSIRITDMKGIPQMPKRYQSHKIEGRSAKKIMIEFAKLVKFYRGE